MEKANWIHRRPLLVQCCHCQRSSLGSFGVSVTLGKWWSYQQHCSMHAFEFTQLCRSAFAGIWDRKCEMHACSFLAACCHSGSLLTGNGRLVQCHQSCQVPLPTGGLPGGQRRGGEEGMGSVVELVVKETRDGSVETVMGFLKAPVCWKAITLQIMSMHSFLTAFSFFLSCSWCLNWLETSWRKALWRKQVPRFAPWFCLEEPSAINFRFPDLNRKHGHHSSELLIINGSTHLWC